MMNSPPYYHCPVSQPASATMAPSGGPSSDSATNLLAIRLAAENTTQNAPSDRARAKRLRHRTIIPVRIVADHPPAAISHANDINDISNECKDKHRFPMRQILSRTRRTKNTLRMGCSVSQTTATSLPRFLLRAVRRFLLMPGLSDLSIVTSHAAFSERG
jgi:hypothetical protein